jgi:hypothetical protein
VWQLLTSVKVAPLSVERWAESAVPKDHSSTPASALVAIGPGALLAGSGWVLKGVQVSPPSLEEAPLPWSPQPARTT